MKRKIIQIDQETCIGCGLCAEACHEGAIEMVDGKAVLVREDYCDGLGDCLPVCPTGAITFTEKEVEEIGEKETPAAGGCPGTKFKGLRPVKAPRQEGTVPSQLSQWPVQIKLAPVSAPYFQGAELLIAADCAAYAYGNFHSEFIHGKVTLIGCPKLDSVDYSEKLAAIFSQNDIASVTVARMEVPCCGGIENAVKAALSACEKSIPCEIVTISVDGRILERG